MQQRQPRLGDILDDYCPRERRLTNHAVVAMIGDAVQQTRCTTCEAEHAYKQAKVPRQRRKSEEPAALYAQVLAGGPKRVTHEPSATGSERTGSLAASQESTVSSPDPVTAEESEGHAAEAPEARDERDLGTAKEAEEGPVHRQLIRATLPRHEGQAAPARPAPDFTIRQPAGRQNRFRPRDQRGGPLVQGNRPSGSMGGGVGRGGPSRESGGRPPHGAMTSHPPRRHDAGRKRSK